MRYSWVWSGPSTRQSVIGGNLDLEVKTEDVCDLYIQMLVFFPHFQLLIF